MRHNSIMSILFSFLSVTLSVIVYTSAECLLDLQKDISLSNQPVFVKDYSLVIPDLKQCQGNIIVNTHENLTLACPGKKNKLRYFSKSSEVGKCEVDNTIYVEGQDLNVKNIQCKTPVDSFIQGKGMNCGNIPSARIFKIGFMVDSKLAELIVVCHDMKDSRTLYVQHKVYCNVKKSQAESSRPSFRVGDSSMFKGLPPNKAYSRGNQIKVFQEILGSEQEAKEMINNSMFLARGHLAPDGDFLFAAWQFATYYYANVHPQFQSINGGNWLHFESSVRALAHQTGKTLDVITGVVGEMTLNKKPVYLDPRNKAIPVPSEFFKIVYEPISKSGIAIVCSNNPFLKSPPMILCKKDICDEYNWPNLKNLKKGYCYCCDSNEFSDNIGFVPKYNAQSILPFQ